MKLSTAAFIVEPESTTDETSATDACPRCGKALVDPAGLGWCGACGYCKSLEEDESKKLLTDKKGPSLGGVVEAGSAISSLPLWFWACFLFASLGILFGIVMDQRLPSGDNLDRATWTTLQIAAGLLTIFLAQVCALVTIAPEEPTLSFKDALAPMRLWGLIFKRLPRCKECLWAALVGLSLVVGAAVFIGGLQHWFTYLPKSQAEMAKQKAATGTGGAVVLPE